MYNTCPSFLGSLEIPVKTPFQAADVQIHQLLLFRTSRVVLNHMFRIVVSSLRHKILNKIF